MATVYLAQDLRHDRPVALKLLNPELGAVLGPERFLSEIRVTANLQHPNILPLFDSGAADGLLYYVMPYVEGETLRARLNREKQLPVDEAVRMTVAVAGALDYAHSHGVIHRDLKPENILLQAGQPVIADFGIALAVSNAGGNRITQTGLSLGTPQYMSPEQATGDRVIDGRSDIYSLGAVAYEMLTGEPPHTGSTSQAIIARMLTENPRPMRTTRPSIPEHVDFAVKHALEKLPADRFSTAHEFAEAMQGKAGTASTGFHSSQHTSVRDVARSSWKARAKDPLTLGLGAIAIAALALAVLHRPAAPPQRVVRYIMSTVDSLRPAEGTPWPGAISPDGSVVVYSPARVNLLYSLRTDELEPRPIPGTKGGGQALFSPDGQWIAFESSGKLRKVRLDGSAPTSITDASSLNGGDWSSRDEIVLGSEGSRRGLSSVSAAGGELTEFAKPDKSKGETDYLWPIAAPDGKSFAFVIWSGSLASAKLATVSDKGTDVTELGVKGVRPLAIIGRELIYVQIDGAVMALPLDRSLRKRAGNPVSVLDPVFVPQNTNGNSEIFVSKNGALLTSRGGTNSQLSWISPNGTVVPVMSEIKAFGEPRLSPDGRRIALAITEEGKNSLWVRDLASGTFSRVASVPGVGAVEWSKDGSMLYYIGLDENQQSNIFIQPASGLTEPKKVSRVDGFAGALSIAPDDKSIVYSGYGTNNSWNLYSLQLGSPSAPQPLIATTANEINPALSPDGKWLAYSSDQSGRSEIFLRSYPKTDVGLQVSSAGGFEVRWSDDGTKLYYRAGPALLVATLSKPDMHVVSRDTVSKAFGSLLATGVETSFDMAKDGRVLGRISNRDDYQLVIVPNWKVELDRKLAENSH
jgi:serine/threonine protein kinase